MSVLIGLPFYNDEETLPYAIQSVFAQNYSNWKLLLIDDGSSDSSLEIALGVKDSRVTVSSDGKNKKLSARLNEITSYARSKYIARMDADDIMHPNRLQKQIGFLEANSEVDLVGTNVYTYDDEYEITGIVKFPDGNLDNLTILRKKVICHPTVVGRVDWFRNNPYDESYVRAQDRDLWCRTLIGSNLANLNEPMLFKREKSDMNKKNYYMTCYSDRRIILKYGPSIVGPRWTMLLFMESMCKSLISRFISIDRLKKVLLKNNAILFPSRELLDAQEVLNSVIRMDLLHTSKILVSSKFEF